MKAERPETLTVTQGLSPLDWVQESRRSRSSLFLVLAMERKAVIGRAPDGDWYGAHAMEISGYLREENAERMIYCCASLRSGSGVEAVAPKSEAFRASLAALPVVYNSEECRWSR